ncbi:heat shock factor protein 2 [Trichonephila clavipes]|nr:heat shock factor protein 2 [Trichonephila clavipes]GFX67689.1 heat shock factor protein 2 [Trichonephila clavipes]
MIDLTHTTQYSNGDKEYLNPYFVKGRPDLLHQVARNSLRSSVKVSPILKKDKPGDNEKRNGNKECFVPPKPGTYWLQPTGLCSSNPKCKHTATVLSNKKLKDKCCDSNCFRKQTQIQKEVHYSPFSDSQYDLAAHKIKQELIIENEKDAEKFVEKKKKNVSVFSNESNKPRSQEKRKRQTKEDIDDPQYGGMNKRITITEKDGALVFSQIMTKTSNQKKAMNINSLYAVMNNSITLSPHHRELVRGEKVFVTCHRLINSVTCTQHPDPPTKPDIFISGKNEGTGYEFGKLKALYRPITIFKMPTLKCLQEKTLDSNTWKLIFRNYNENDSAFIRPEAKDIVLTSAALGITCDDPNICYLCCGDIIKSIYI